jgi:N utilization substance protein B
MSRRRASRERLLQALFQFHLTHGWPELSALHQHFVADEADLAEDAGFTLEVLVALRTRIDEVDDLLRAASKNWRLERMAAVDLSLLRLATVELLLETAPPPVVLDEAVELAKRFGTETSASFVNGVLDGVLRHLQAA